MGLRIYQGKSSPVLLFVPCSEMNVCSKSYIYATYHICMRIIGVFLCKAQFRPVTFYATRQNCWLSLVSARVGGEEVMKGICFVMEGDETTVPIDPILTLTAGWRLVVKDPIVLIATVSLMEWFLSFSLFCTIY